MKVVVVIPTYNESENIKLLIPELAQEFSSIPHDCHVLVVDGNSPDGTGKIVTELAKSYPFVHLLTETAKRGLGAAYLQAFDYAMHEMHAEVVVEMDADYQHDPRDIKRFLVEIDNGADYVIGSRFVAGGSIPKEWALYRKLLSRGGNLFSKIVLWMWGINDFTSGFKATRVHGFLDRIDFSTVMSTGFAYKMDLLFKMHCLGAKITEVPIAFGLRDRGDSKMERGNFLDSLKVVLLLRYNRNKSFFRFLAVGSVGLVTDILLANLLRLTPMPPNVAASSAALVAMGVTFSLNNLWSFNDRAINSLWAKIRKFALYVVFSAVPIVFRYFFVHWVVSTFADTFILYNTAVFISIVFGLIWNFTVYSRIIWKQAKPAKHD